MISMSPQKKLRLSRCLMIVGITPWAIVFVWIFAILFLNVRGRPPSVFMLDPIAMIGLTIITYAYAAMVAGLGTLWSFLLTRSNPELESTDFTELRRAVMLALMAPPLLALVPAHLYMG